MNKCVSLAAVLLAFNLAACGMLAQNATTKLPTTEFLFYRWEGGLSPYNWFEVTIQNDGQSKVSFERQREKAISMTLTLTPFEMQALKTRIRAARDVYLREIVSTVDSGQTLIRLTQDGRVVEGSANSSEPLALTTQFVDRMFNQAVILHDLEEKDDAYAALGAVSDSYAAPKVLQPAALEMPLRALLHRSNDLQKLSDALGALSKLVTPDELLGMTAAELVTAAPDRKITLLHAICRAGQLSPAHQRALIPLLSLQLQAVCKTLPDLPHYPQQVYVDMIRFLGTQRDAQAVPVLILIAEAEAQPTIANQGSREWTRTALAETGYSAIAPLSTLLDSKSADTRTYALDTFCMMVTITPQGRSPDERHQAISYLKQIIPNFELLAKNDADENVRQAAAKAIALLKVER